MCRSGLGATSFGVWVARRFRWSIGEHYENMDPSGDAEALYAKLERAVLPMFYQRKRKEEYARVRQLAIAYNGSFFNAQRMVLQYARHVYRLQYAQGSAEDGAAPPHRARARSRSPLPVPGRERT